MTKFYNKFKKPCFWLIFGPFFHFPNLGAKRFFWKIRLSRTTSYGFLAPGQNLRKTNDTIPRKRSRQTDERKEGQKDVQTLLHRTLSATAECPKKHIHRSIEKNITVINVEKWLGNKHLLYKKQISNTQQN